MIVHLASRGAALLALLLPAAAAAPAAEAGPPPAGATACSGCHAPASRNGPVPPLAGLKADDIVTAMAEYRAGRRDATVMARIAKGFTEDETRAIAAWWAAATP
jgi:cytochrome c553